MRVKVLLSDAACGWSGGGDQPQALAGLEVEPEVANMAEGGFLIRFDGRKAKPQRGYGVAFDYDEWSYALNNQAKKKIPKGTKKITIEIELG